MAMNEKVCFISNFCRLLVNTWLTIDLPYIYSRPSKCSIFKKEFFDTKITKNL